MNERKLALEERYETVSSHITIARIPEKLKNPKELISYIKNEHLFGTMKVSSFEFSFHNWYDTRKEIISHINLG